MNPRNFLNNILALALAGLIVLVVYVQNEEDPADILLTKLKPADIQQIVIEQMLEQRLQTRILLKKTNDVWQMKEPINNQANKLRINKLLDISQAKSHSQYLASNINLKQLKLDAPDLTISLNDTKLFFGTTDALNGYRYIQIEDTVHLITDRFSHLIRGQATALLNPALLPKNTAITKLVLPKLTLQTTETGWQTSPDNKSISADSIQQLLDEWRFARALRVNKKIVYADNQAAGYTSGNNRATIEIQTNGNQTLRFKLRRTKDEIILERPDTELQYHFSKEAGERLLKLPSMPSNTPNSN